MEFRDRQLFHRRAPLGLALLAAVAAGCAGSRASPEPRPEGDVSPFVMRDLEYAQREGATLRADVYRPALPGPRPAVLLVHPGAWVSGDKSHVAGVAHRLANRGYVAVAAQYRLAPEHPFPAPLHDLKEAVRWMRAHADELSIDPERIGAFGYSSGGHLASLLASTEPTSGLEGPTRYPGTSSRLQAVVIGGAPSDLAEMFSVPPLRSFLGGSAEEQPERYRAASPLTHVSRRHPPTFLYHGRLDWFIGGGHAKRMLAALRRVGVESQLRWANSGHFATFLFGAGHVARSIDFLDEWIGAEANERLAGQRRSVAPETAS